MQIKQRILSTIVCFVLLCCLFGCNQKSTQDGAGSAPASAPPDMSSHAEMDAVSEKAIAPESRNDLAKQSGTQPTQLAQPQIIKTVQITLQVDNIEKTLKLLHKTTARYQGMITNQSYTLSQQGSYYRSGSLDVRVPQERLDAYLEELPALGIIFDQQISGTDVGAEIVDSEARIRNLKAEEASLQSIMQRAGKIPDVLEVSRELTRVRGEIEQLQSRLAYLKQQVAYSTVHIALSEKGVASPTETRPGLGSSLNNALKEAIGALYDVVVFLLQCLIWLLVFITPFLLFIGLILLLLWKMVFKALFGWLINSLNQLSQRFKRH